MHKWLLFLLAGGALHAAIIKGSVVENQTGKALARTLVSITPLPGSAGPTATARTNTYGMFEFVDLPGGAYLIHAARRGFMTAQYGQKNWRAAGQPGGLGQEPSPFLSIRLARFSSISGAIVDENDVGLPDHEVVAMTNTRPPRMLVKAQADDRGMYRIAGLDPGAYLVRTLARPFGDGIQHVRWGDDCDAGERRGPRNSHHGGELPVRGQGAGALRTLRRGARR